MKRTICLIFILVGVSSFALSQGIGLKAGLNISNQIINNKTIHSSVGLLNGFHLGVVGDVKVSEKTYFSPGLLYSVKGSKDNDDIKNKLSYITIPLDFKVKYTVEGMKLFFKVGSEFGYAISGKVKSDDEEADIEFGSEEGQIKRLDLGVDLGVGIEILSTLQLEAAYTLGLTTIMSENVERVKMKNRNFAVSMTYFFIREKK